MNPIRLFRLITLITFVCVCQHTGSVRAAASCQERCDIRGGYCLENCPAAAGPQCQVDCAEEHTTCSNNCAGGTSGGYSYLCPQLVTFTTGGAALLQFGRYDSTGMLLPEQGAVTAVDFSILDLGQITLDTTMSLDTVTFAPLGPGTFNTETSLWEYHWTTDRSSPGSIYMIRGAFHPHSDSATNDNGYAAALCIETTIPTLSEWGMIIFCVLLFGFMAWMIVRRKKEAIIRM